MPLYYIFLFWFASSFLYLFGQIHPSRINEYRRLIAEAKQNPTEETVIAVLDTLRSSYRYMDHKDEGNVAMYLELKRGALELPNHLEYLRAPLETSTF